MALLAYRYSRLGSSLLVLLLERFALFLID